MPNAFKTSFILSSPFSPPLNGSGHRWQQTSLLDDEGRAHVLHHTAPSTLENVRWKFFFLFLPHCPGSWRGTSPFDVPRDAQYRGATSLAEVSGHLAEVSGKLTPGPRPTSTL